MKIFLGIIIAIGLILSLSTTIYGQKNDNDYNDLILELEGEDNPAVKRFEIKGKVYEEICPSNQCEIEYIHPFLSAPDPNLTSLSVGFGLDFYLHDNITNSDLTPIQKKFIERFDMGITCLLNNVDDIIEKNGQVIYNCESNPYLDRRGTDSPTWHYIAKGIYNTTLNNFKLFGKFDYKTQ